MIYTDFTELVYADGRRRAYVIPILDHATKVVSSCAVGERAATKLAPEAWGRAEQSFQTCGINYRGMIVHHDQDSVFTDYGWTAELLDDQLHPSYALRGTQHNPERACPGIVSPRVVGSGAVEKNIEPMIGRRFKKRGMSWSREGANNLSKPWIERQAPDPRQGSWQRRAAWGPTLGQGEPGAKW